MDPRQVVRAFVDAMDRHELDESLVTEDHRFIINDRVAEGLPALRDNWCRWFELVPDSRTTLRELVHEGDLVVAHIEVSGTRLAKPDGEELNGRWSFPAMALCRVRDGRVAEWREVCGPDTVERMEALVKSAADAEADT